VETVAAAFTHSLVEPRSVGQTYDLCGPEALTLSDIVDRIQEVLGKRRLQLHVPLSLARSQTACMEFLFRRLLRKPPPFNRDQLLMLQEDNVGNPQPANELFGLQPVALRDGITKYVMRRE
jgi:NADH dehydrogenase